eukprot:gnl/TRDRNA2_/TRDRNA2_177993_c0_seq7.p3 gnl/TRDRNA2_/TRDRNA2_177993_c0~~gnl/TRDRNA2_/TRDRNA2_177993_c0_seq7.p3  ORF type:complete len:156 (+),score=4.16 gnl/TRDRNA2_/TRDRNA2_177993_c0_seq7:2404-2871(+)
MIKKTKNHEEETIKVKKNSAELRLNYLNSQNYRLMKRKEKITERIYRLKKMVVLKHCIVLHNISQKVKEVTIDTIESQASENRFIKNEKERSLDREIINSTMFQHQNEKKRVLEGYIDLKKEIKEYCESLCKTMKLTNKTSLRKKNKNHTIDLET